jgi:K+-sensing histidine kinase KdpD
MNNEGTTVMNVFRLFARGKVGRRTLDAMVFVSMLVLVLAFLQKFVNITTIAFALLLGVLFTAIYMGSKPALAASVIAMLDHNFFSFRPSCN